MAPLIKSPASIARMPLGGVSSVRNWFSAVTFLFTLLLLPVASLATSGAPARGFGTAECVITWQYNDAIGTKGDVGAFLFLLPRPMSQRFTSDDVNTIWTATYNGTFPLTTKVANVLADGYGHADIDHVPSGSYDMLVISHGAFSMASLSDDYIARFRPFFANDAAFSSFFTDPRSVIKGFKSALIPMTIHAGETSHCSHDFGNAAI
jgi:hypothetical protein